MRKILSSAQAAFDSFSAHGVASLWAIAAFCLGVIFLAEIATVLILIWRHVQ